MSFPFMVSASYFRLTGIVGIFLRTFPVSNRWPTGRVDRTG
jgi:hypothetical protein